MSVADGQPLFLIIAKASRLCNIPTIVFQHGLLLNGIDEASEMDYILSYSEETKRNYIRIGNSDKKIKIVGNTQYDSFIKMNRKNTKKIIYAMEISSGIRSLTPETLLGKKRQKINLRRIFRVMKKFPDYQLIIKIRPKWDMKNLPSKIAKEEGFKNFEVIEKSEEGNLINNCDVFLINWTTMGLAALFLNKPVISVTFKEYDKINPYKKMGIVEMTYTERQLEKAIKKCIDQKKIDHQEKETSLNNFILTDKNSSQRAANFINKILKRN